MNADTQDSRLSIANLMAVSLTVAIYFAVDRWCQQLRNDLQAILNFSVDQQASTTDFVLAVGYGAAIGLAIIVCTGKGRPFWQHPGKIMVSILAAMAMLSSLLSLFALLVAKSNASMNVLGFHYQNFSPAIGYLVGTLIMLIILFRNQTPWHWRIAWAGILLFSMAALGTAWLTGYQSLVQSPGVLGGVQSWLWSHFQLNFLMWVTIAMVGVAFAFCVDRARRVPQDWITLGIVGVMTLMWAAVGASIAMNQL